MGASQFVGRVGGLAVALGVGAAVFSTAGWPRLTVAPRRSPRFLVRQCVLLRRFRTRSQHRRAVVVRSRACRRCSRAADQELKSSALPSVEPASVPAPAAAVSAPAPRPPRSLHRRLLPPRAAEAVEAPAPEPAVADVTPVSDPVVVSDPAPEAAPSGEVVAYSATGILTSTGGAGSDPSAPVGHPIVDLLLASFIKRENAASSATASQTASATSSSPRSGLTYFDGIIQGQPERDQCQRVRPDRQ